MDSLIGLVGALAPDHVPHAGHQVVEAPESGDVQVMCGCSVRLTFLAAQIAAIASSPSPSSSTPKPGWAKGARDGS